MGSIILTLIPWTELVINIYSNEGKIFSAICYIMQVHFIK